MKNKYGLPDWLNKHIFDDIGAVERPDPKEFCKNLKADNEKNKVYLGTYFPRSFAESYCIHANLFGFAPYSSHLQTKDKLSILSIGCGTGGDILGLICAIGEYLPNVRGLRVVAFDGNNIAIDYLSDMLELEPIKQRFKIDDNDKQFIPLPVTSIEDLYHYLENIDEEFDFITSFKFVNELMDVKILQRDGFKDMAKLLAPKLKENGLMTLLDITDKHYDIYQPKNLNAALCAFSRENEAFKTLLPIPCHFFDKKCSGANCFTNKVFEGTFGAIDKVVYRVIGRAEFVDRIYPRTKEGGAYSINTDVAICPGFRGKDIMDAFDINS